MGPAECGSCHRPRGEEDSLAYHPSQVIYGGSVGWYSGDDGELCGQCMARIMGAQ